MNSLKGKVVLITGAGRGIGRATALILAKNGAKVVINYLNSKDEAAAVVSEIRLNGGAAQAVPADITRREDVSRMMTEVKNSLGLVDILINNATAPIDYKTFTDLDWSEFQKHLDVQIKGAYNMVKAVLPNMIERKGGNIINVVTTATLGAPPLRMSGYTTAKYGLLGLTKVLAEELGKFEIRVNAVSPGLVETDLTGDLPPKYKELAAAETPLGRNARPEDAAKAILFLASSESEFITGVNIPVCGGSDM